MTDKWPFDLEELFVYSMLASLQSYFDQLGLREFWLDRIEESLIHPQQNKNQIQTILKKQSVSVKYLPEKYFWEIQF